MIFELVNDFSDALAAVPEDYPRRRAAAISRRVYLNGGIISTNVKSAKSRYKGDHRP